MNTATLNALAFNEPNKLTVERDTAIAAARHTVRDSATDDAWRAAAARLTAAVESGNLLSDA